jgi:hypothetical protein
MNSRTIINLCLKVMGVYYALSALNMLPTNVSQIILTWDSWKFAAKDDHLQLLLNFKFAALANLLIPVLLFIISLFVIFKSERISTFILKSEDSFQGEKLDNDNLLNISIKIFGFFSILSSIPPISSLLSKYVVMKDSILLYDDKGKIELASSALEALLYILAGAILIYYSADIAKRVSARNKAERGET